MDYQYIQKGEEVLYSVYHEPKKLKNNQIGIVLAYPLGQEYIRCHKMYENLARNLSQEGYHVLRFDYSGTGDSSGEFESITLQQNLSDINLAVNELKVYCNVNKIILIGTRIGGTLSLIYSKDNPVNALILLNPIYDGKKYIKEIVNDYKKWLSGSFTKEKINKGAVLSYGFHYSSNLINEIQEIRLKRSDFIRHIPILLFDTEVPFDIEDIRSISFKKSVSKEFWLKKGSERDKSMVPVHELSLIMDWMSNINNQI